MYNHIEYLDVFLPTGTISNIVGKRQKKKWLKYRNSLTTDISIVFLLYDLFYLQVFLSYGKYDIFD